VHLEAGDVLAARTIVLACGVSWRRLPLDGLDRLAGKGVFYGAARSDAATMHGQDVHVVGAGNSAGQAALEFSKYAHTVTIVSRGESLEKSMSRYLVDQLATKANIDVACGAQIVAAHGDPSLEEVEIRRSADGTTTRSPSAFDTKRASPSMRARSGTTLTWRSLPSRSAWFGRSSTNSAPPATRRPAFSVGPGPGLTSAWHSSHQCAAAVAADRPCQ